MPWTRGVDQWADPSKQSETRRDMIARRRLMFEQGEGEKENKQKQKERILGGDEGGRQQGERRGVQAGTGSGGLSWGDGLWLTGEGGSSRRLETGTWLNRGYLWRGGGLRSWEERGESREETGRTQELGGSWESREEQGETGRRTTKQKLNKRKFKVCSLNRKSIL